MNVSRSLCARPTLLCLAGLVVGASCVTACSNRESPEVAPGPRILDDVSGAGCPHSYFPLVKGARWTYRLGQATDAKRTVAEIRVLDITRRGNLHTAKIKRSVGIMVTEVEAVCNNDGTSFLAFFVPLGPPLPVSYNFSPRITKRTGVLLPPVQRLRSGQTWTHEIEAHTSQPAGRALTMDSMYRVEAEYRGERIVTVPAGRYDTKQVRFVVNTHHRPPEEEDVVFTERMMDPPPMDFTYSIAEGVGVVLIEGEPPPDRPRTRARWELTKVDRIGN